MTKRPLGTIGAVFFLTVLALSRFGYEASLYLVPIFLIAVFVIFLKRKKLAFFALISSSVLCACLIFFAADNTFRINEEYFSGENISVEGVISERPYTSNNKHYLVVKCSKINGESVSAKIRVSMSSLPESTSFYDKVSFNANLYKTDSYDDSVMRSFKSKNICLTGSVAEDTFKSYENGEKSLMYSILSYRYSLFDTVSELLPNDIGGFIAGITIGEKSLISNSMLENFRVTGTSHILVVSGLHIAIWSGFLYWLLRKFLSRRVSSAASIVFLLVFMAFTGFTPSVMRAGFMMILNYFAIIFNEKPDSLNTLGISALVLTAVDPFSIFNVGTVFSFASVFGILLMNEYVNPKIKSLIDKIKFIPLRKAVNYALSLILVSLSAQLFTFPVSVLYNIDFSFLSIAVNFLISSLCSFAMVTGGLGMVMLTFSGNFIFGKLFFGASVELSKLVLAVINKFSEFDNFYFNVATRTNRLALVLIVLLLAALVFLNMSAKKKAAVFSALLVPIFLLANAAQLIYCNNFVELAVIDVGYGMCVTLSHSGESVMLACGGGYGSADKTIDYLNSIGTRKIKSLYLPVNGNASLANNAKDIKAAFEIERVITSSEYKFSYICENCVSADYVSAEYFGGKAKIEYYTYKNCSFALVFVNGNRILIDFYGKLKQENLPQGCINPDVYVTMYQNTYKTDFSATGEYVVSTSYKTSVPASAQKVHSTFNDSTYIKSIKV